MSTSLTPPRLEARDLSVSLPGDAGPVRVFQGVSFDVAPGEIVDVSGASGSGKTTLLRTLARLMPGATGSLAVDGQRADAMAPQRWRALVALLPQKPAILPGDLRTNLVLPWRLKVERDTAEPGSEALLSALDEVGLGGLPLDRDAARLSVGQQARVALLRVVLTGPRVLLLDEPDAALDPESSSALAQAFVRIAATGTAIVRVRHRESDGLAARRLVLTQGGRLMEVGR